MRKKAPTIRLPRELARRARVAVIRAEFNSDITASLEKACLAELRAAGVGAGRTDRFSVPGCLELPIMAQRIARRGRHDVIIALGAVIRGDTYHFELVASECARGIMEVSLRHDIPVIFEVLAVYKRRDALRRASNNRLNKGVEAASAALAILAGLEAVT
jgi:6,7-dimethyl-8-ribityllumazine synthase